MLIPTTVLLIAAVAVDLATDHPIRRMLDAVRRCFR